MDLRQIFGQLNSSQFLQAVQSASIGTTKTTLSLREPRWGETISFEMRAIKEPTGEDIVCCVYRSSSLDWMQLVNEKLPLSVFAVETVPTIGNVPNGYDHKGASVIFVIFFAYVLKNLVSGFYSGCETLVVLSIRRGVTSAPGR